MVFLIISDIHNQTELLKQTLEKHRDVDGVFFLGDGINNFNSIIANYPNLLVYAVSGNSDMGSIAKDEFVDIEGFHIMFTHGNLYGVKKELDTILDAAVKNNADILLFGHTHMPFTVKQKEVLMFNPGALAKNFCEYSYGIMILQPNCVPEFKHIIKAF